MSDRVPSKGLYEAADHREFQLRRRYSAKVREMRDRRDFFRWVHGYKFHVYVNAEGDICYHLGTRPFNSITLASANAISKEFQK